MNYLVAALYHFTNIEDPTTRQTALLELCRSRRIRGTILLAHEGINGTIAGARDDVRAVIEHIGRWQEIGDLEVKFSETSVQPFKRMKVKIKDEIVSMRAPGVNVARDVGVYVDPLEWNDLISHDDVMVIDTRNSFEVEIGRFRKALDPGIGAFHEFPEWAHGLASSADRPRAVAMYCTGGIRCEKATAYVRNLGFDEVYHLKGGILKYLETIPEEDSLWEGECFVFDDRVSLTHDLKKGEYEVCYGCQSPVSPDDRESDMFEPGVSCPKCAATLSDIDRERLHERQRQMALAAAHGYEHMKDDATTASLNPE